MDLVTLAGIGVVAFAAILMYRRSLGDAVEEEDDRAANQRRDVLRAMKSMRKE